MPKLPVRSAHHAGDAQLASWTGLLCLAALCAVLAGCASQPPAGARSTAALLHDEYFPEAAAPVAADDVFALSPAMRQYADAELGHGNPSHDPRRALIEALYGHGQLRLEYDAGATRNAAQAFEARAGNCLSLVIMSAAFAKYLDLPVSFQSVAVDELYTRSGGLTLASGHVNLVLGRVPGRRIIAQSVPEELVVDFLPGAELRGMRGLPLQEATVTAMYMNNRAAENLAAGRLDESYRWARAAVLQDPGLHNALNTLAVVYLRSGHPGAAEAALQQVLLREPENVSALSNLAGLLARAGRVDEAQAVQARLARVQPIPPFRDFDLGRRAMDEGDFRQARELFARELRRQPYQPEVHFWAALAEYRLGDNDRAARHLREAVDNSTTPGAQALYAAKLERLRALRSQ